MPTSSLQDLLAQRAALEAQIAVAQSSERANAIQQVRSVMAEHGLTIADLTAKTVKGPKTGSTVAAKYRDPETGATWSGRGLKPKWLAAKIDAGKKLEEFAV
ncbi:H-NS histone family protein [Paucibacter sp. M5-1]|uniref:H-NS histone family protein n=1 Tax=Paucibacter sp. M5-1 TaxID=3015998 RepID=UPI0022B8A464|nr:H-NS histone family protein [Paucibacter sp. M5-1]MCZ7881246.1 H-NS histone family protein [Paucibacter sp. M5-1]